jgi:acyl-CoA dehydrogenase
MYLATCLLKKFDIDGAKKDDETLLEYAMEDLFSQMQEAFDGIWRNIFTSLAMKTLSAPVKFLLGINSLSYKKSDNLETKIAKQYLENDNYRDDLTKGVYLPKDKKQQLARLENALKLFKEMQDIFLAIKKASQNGVLPKEKPENLVDLAFQEKLISKKEVAIIKKAQEAIYDAILVDEYSVKEYQNI